MCRRYESRVTCPACGEPVPVTLFPAEKATVADGEPPPDDEVEMPDECLRCNRRFTIMDEVDWTSELQKRGVT